MTGLVERLYGPHEWGYRDPVEGGFIEDGTPFEAAEALSRATDEEGLIKVAMARLEGYRLQQGHFGHTAAQMVARALVAHIKGEKPE